MLIIKCCFFKEDSRESKSFPETNIYIILLPILLILARSPWLPGVGKHHNYLINIWSWPPC